MEIDPASLSQGSKFELDVLGFSSIGFNRNRKYTDYIHSLDWVVHHQPEGYQPNSPTHPLTEDLFEKVCKYIPKRWRKWLRLYIAIGSNFDQYHGVDAFFFLNGSIVTLDVTSNPEKVESKSDFLLTPADVDLRKSTASEVLACGLASCLVQRCNLAKRK